MCSSMGMLNCVDTTSGAGAKLQHQQQAPTSPTASVSESNIVAPSVSADIDANDALASLQALRFDGDIDVEIQSPDIAMWESLFAEQMGAAGGDFLMLSPRRDFMAAGSPSRRDFMVSSPKRDYMVSSSPKRDYMISSPMRDLMASSPKREYMVSSPRRDSSSSRRSPFSPNLFSTSGGGHQHGYAAHGPTDGGVGGAGQPLYGGLANHHGKGKSQSPLHKGYINNSGNKQSTGPSSLSCSSSYGHADNDLLPSLPSMDTCFLDDYKDGGYIGYQQQMPGKQQAAAGIMVNNNGGCSTAVGVAPSPSHQLPTLSECLAMPEPAFLGGEEAAAGGLQMGVGLPSDLYYAGQFAGGGGGGGLTTTSSLQHQMAKSDHQWAAAESSLHSMLGSVIQTEADEQVIYLFTIYTHACMQTVLVLEEFGMHIEVPNMACFLGLLCIENKLKKNMASGFFLDWPNGHSAMPCMQTVEASQRKDDASVRISCCLCEAIARP